MGRPKGKTWGEPLAAPEREARWRAWGDGLDQAIATLRQAEGFDGSRQACPTLEDLLLAPAPQPAPPAPTRLAPVHHADRVAEAAARRRLALEAMRRAS